MRIRFRQVTLRTAARCATRRAVLRSLGLPGLALLAVMVGAGSVLAAGSGYSGTPDSPVPGASSGMLAPVGFSGLASELAAPGCVVPGGMSAQARRTRRAIAAAGSLDEARALAAEPLDAALAAVRTARRFAPFSEDLQLAAARLGSARRGIRQSHTASEVAEVFSNMTLAGLDADNAADIRVANTKCQYSTGEVIAVVVGLILGIIPGLILLVVLC